MISTESRNISNPIFTTLPEWCVLYKVYGDKRTILMNE